MKAVARDNHRALVVFALAVCVHAAFCLSLHYHFLDRLFYSTSHSKGQGGPFFGIYQAGVNLMNGESIYASDNYAPPRHVVVPYYHFYRYLPFASYVSGIVSKIVSPWAAYWTWIAVNEILLALCIVLTVRLRVVFGAAAIGVAGFWLLYSPIYVELYTGQFCLTMTFFIFLVIYPFILRSRSAEPEPSRGARAAGARGPAPAPRLPSWLSTVPWIASVLLKSFTVLYTFTFFRIGKRKLALAGLALAALTSAPYFFLHRADLSWFFHLNLQPLPPRLTGGCFGFCGFARAFFNASAPFLGSSMIRIGAFDIYPRNIPLILLAAAIVVTTLAITIRQRKIDPVSNIALWTLTFFLVFKDIWEYHYVILIPLFIAFYLETRSRFLLVLFILLAVPTPFFLYDVPSSEDPQLMWSTPLTLTHHAWKAVPTFLFYLWVVRRELKEMASSRGEARHPEAEPT